jgi:subtilase family serine protease
MRRRSLAGCAAAALGLVTLGGQAATAFAAGMPAHSRPAGISAPDQPRHPGGARRISAAAGHAPGQAGSGGRVSAAAARARAPWPPAGFAVTRGPGASPGSAGPAAALTAALTAAGPTAGGAVSSGPGGGYTPAQLQAAYGVSPLLARGINGSGQTIAIVDPFGSPTIRHDLTVFDSKFRLPTSLKIIFPEGPVGPLSSPLSRAWAAETTLDVEWAHAVAPHAKILLAETPASATESLTKFVQTITKAVRFIVSSRLAGVISQSLDVTEQNLGSATLAKFSAAYGAARSHRITVVAAAGDTGPTNYRPNGTTRYLRRVVAWPASDPQVTAVGGTDAQLNAAGGRIRPDTVWSDGGFAGGGGRSAMFARPAYQNSVGGAVGARRGVPDVALSAGCNPGVGVYHSFRGMTAGWTEGCGTSESTPLLAGLIALAGQAAGHSLGLVNPALYRLAAAHSAAVTDITSGSNTVSFRQGGRLRTVPGFGAKPGYDLASGVGTVKAGALVRALAGERQT